MASIYSILKQIYKSTVPVPMQEMTWSRRYPFWRIVEPIKKFLGKWASHDEIYDRYYFEETVDASAMRSAETICNFIIEVFKPTSVIDIGCGTGALLSRLAATNIECMGLENADAAIAIALQRNVKVKKFDLEQDNQMIGKWDLALSTEVAEHLPASCADRFVDLLTQASDRVLITAATPGQGGTDHVNEQPNSYWIEKFRVRKFRFDEGLTQQARSKWSEQEAASFYSKNVMIFLRAG